MNERPAPATWFDLGPRAAKRLAEAMSRASSDAAASAWRERFGEAMAAALGSPSEQPELAQRVADGIPDVGDEMRQQLPLVGLADALPATMAFMRRREIDDDVIRASLADVGRTERKNGAWFGRPGLDSELAVWLNRHLYGAIYQLGRLQFERLAVGDGDVVLSVHIPAGMGPIAPAAVDDSLALARPFFARHFPDEQPRRAICVSWLLDPQLTEYLPETSNIVTFQRRFDVEPVEPGAGDSDESVRRFVFGEARTPLAEQPATTTLERAIHAHLSGGRHFISRRGSFSL